MLKQRILTAIVLLAVLTAALLASSPWPFLVLLTLACALACWEWLRMTASHTSAVWVAAVLFVALLGGAFVALTPSSDHTHDGIWIAALFNLTALACFVWVVVVPVMLRRTRVDVPAKNLTLSAFAVLALAAAWLVLATLFVTRGAWYLVSLLALVWVADVAAYFVGRRWGRRKLATQISPGKSVEGALAGIAAGVVWTLTAAQIEGSFGYYLLRHGGIVLAACFAALLGAASIVGDLFESLIKRRAGVKDSSQLLPGHGGVWDRIDAILPVAPLALWAELLVWARQF